MEATMARETEPTPTAPQKQASERREDDLPPDRQRDEDAAEADHRFRDWALI
jgi:hypothetical protein